MSPQAVIILKLIGVREALRESDKIILGVEHSCSRERGPTHFFSPPVPMHSGFMCKSLSGCPLLDQNSDELHDEV